MMRCLLVSLAVLVVAVAGFFVAGRWYEVSAVRQHPGWLFEGLATGRDVLVGLRARGVALPPGFAPAADPEGAGLYEQHCVHCHGAPGIAPSDFALGMMPVPTNMVHAARERPAEEIFWFVRYGLKMTGMPAWEGRMSDPDMWRITAFVEAMPGLTPADYAALVEAAGGPVEAVDPIPIDGIPDSVATADPERGRRAMQVHGCASCHLIPGMVGPDVRVGPSLEAAGSRRYIAGVLRNTPENMVRWIMDPPAVDPLTLMPDLGVTPGEARDMAAYLYAVAPGPRRTGPLPEALIGREGGIGFDGPASGR